MGGDNGPTPRKPETGPYAIGIRQEELAKAVRFHRKKSGLTQAGLAKLASVGKTVVFDIENGKRSVQLDTVLKIFSVLNITLTLHSPLSEEYLRQSNA